MRMRMVKDEEFELDFADPVQVSPVHPAACFRLDYSVVYSAICDRLNDERTTLLLYLLLHQHQPFRNYVYTHADIQTMVRPALKNITDIGGGIKM